MQTAPAPQIEETKARKVLFVVNPISGGETKAAFLNSLPERGAALGFMPVVLHTTATNDEERIREMARTVRPDVVAAVGGDGTVNLVARALMNFRVALAVVPFGSANGLATDLGIPQDLEGALRVIAGGVEKDIDLIRLNDEHIIVHIGDFGLNAAIVRSYEKSESRGMFEYVKHFFRELVNHQPMRYTIKTDRETLSANALMVAFANSKRYGTGAIVNPIGKIDDGLFELCIFKPFPRLAVLSLAWRFFNGSLRRSPYVDIVSCRRATIKVRRRSRLQIDGEYLGQADKVTLEVLPGAARMLVPAPKLEARPDAPAAQALPATVGPAAPAASPIDAAGA